MGVRRLTAFLEKHRDVYRDELFGKNRLVIDGSDLTQQLYFDSGLEQNHGGEYGAFEELIENFITALRTCNISPHVVLDGGRDVSGKKLKTLAKRAEDRIHRAHRAAVEGSQENILPLLAGLVFKQTLERLEVPMAVCFEEVNQEIAALANEWECPVLSSDSNFCLFDIPAGMLPLSHFQWRALERRDSQSFIPCKIYSISNFCAVLGIQKQLLPVFGALAKQKWPIRWSDFSEDSEEPPCRLQGLLCWLRRFQWHEEAVEATLELIPGLPKEKRQKVRDAFNDGMQEHWLPNSRLKNFFIDGTLPSFHETTDGIPDWIQPLLVHGEMTSEIVEVLRLKKKVLSICVGSCELPSVHLTSRPLRRVMYGLLLPEWDSRFPTEIIESDRVGLKLDNVLVSPIFKIPSENLQLDSLHKAEHCRRLSVLLKALGVREAALSRLLPQLRLPVAVTCYWWKNARPPPGDRLLKALLLGLSFGSSQSHEEVAEIKSHECDSVDANKWNVAVIHSVTQWQVCLKDSVQLNQLLCLPLPEPQISRLYEGAVVHRLVQLMTPAKAKHLLKHNISITEEYEKMLAIVHQSGCQQPRSRWEVKGKHPQEANPGPDLEQLSEPDEEASASMSLSDRDLSLRVRFTRCKQQWIWNKNFDDSSPMVTLKCHRRGGVDV